jgi:hypothetical protein
MYKFKAPTLKGGPPNRVGGGSEDPPITTYRLIVGQFRIPIYREEKPDKRIIPITMAGIKL